MRHLLRHEKVPIPVADDQRLEFDKRVAVDQFMFHGVSEKQLCIAEALADGIGAESFVIRRFVV